MTEGQFQKANLEWARGILARPAYTMPSGRNSHHVAGEVIDEAEDALIDLTRYTADGRRVLA